MRSPLLPLSLLLVLGALGCSRVHKVGPPEQDRCARQSTEAMRKNCEELRDQAFAFARKLAVDDQVCLEGNPIGDGVTSRCRVRAFVADVAQKNVKLEIRDAPPDSKYRPMEDYWFHEAAIADMYLVGFGF
ncbi:MAG: hypothetical protein ACK4N5_00090 [Myxococcales bacterium]